MKSRLSNALWGLLFIIVGVGYAGNILFDWEFSIFFEGFWTLFIIVPCLISMIRNGFGTGSTIGFIIGLLLLANYYVNINFNIWGLIIPSVLILIGIRIIFKDAFRKKTFNYNNSSYAEDPSQGENFTNTTRSYDFTGTARGEYSAIFSGNRIHVTDNFVGASLNAVFGGLVLDLRDAHIPGDIEISAQAIFGGIDIFVPAGVKVKVNNVPIFGGVDNKTMKNVDPSAPTIYLNSTCMFGGIDIK